MMMPTPQSCRVYPRVCGGTFAIPGPGIRGRGLSPRVRGNPVMEEARRLDDGSIPACAGEPVGVGQLVAAFRVYPRVCGGTLMRPAFQPSA